MEQGNRMEQRNDNNPTPGLTRKKGQGQKNKSAQTLNLAKKRHGCNSLKV